MMTKKARVIHMSDEQWERAKTLAKGSGRSISAYFSSLLDLKIPKPLPPDVYRHIYRELAGIGNNINQMARLSHAKGSAEYIYFADALKVVYEIKDMLSDITWKAEDLTDGLCGNNTDKSEYSGDA